MKNSPESDRLLEEFRNTVQIEIERIGKKLDSVYFAEALKLIRECHEAGGRLHITGIGKPHHVANYMASLFSSIGTPCYMLDGTEATHGSSGQVMPGDVVICVSYYGNVPELMKTIDTLKKEILWVNRRVQACWLPFIL